MKFPIYLILATSGLLLSKASYAQYEDQILKFSQAQSGASARIQGLGNAQTALGGDFSSISGNPAGLGMFTKSEISLSPTLNNAQSASSYFGNNQNSDRTAFGLDQIGAVFYSASKRQKGENLENGWLSVNFGIGYNKTQNFNQSIRYSGNNTHNSIADYFATAANQYINGKTFGQDENPLAGQDELDYAQKNYLIDYYNDGYYAPSTSSNNDQYQTTTRWGSQSEFGLGLGANYENKLYIGASLNFTSVNYRYNNNYSEDGKYAGTAEAYTGGLYTAYYTQSNQVKGSGINLKFGAIYRPNSDLRLGISFATPTWYRMSENYAVNVNSDLTTSGGETDRIRRQPSYSTYYYNLTTPYKVSGGLSYIIAKKALITADVDFVDYKSIKSTADDFNFEQKIQNFTQNDLQATVNYRIGAEIKLTKEFMLRGGYNYQGSPYINQKITTSVISGSLGYRAKGFGLDLTYVNTTFNSQESPYRVNEQVAPYANVKNNIGNVVMTMGFSF